MNTDAEGRLVLADGLHYAQTSAPPTSSTPPPSPEPSSSRSAMVNAGLFSNDDESREVQPRR